MTAIPTPGESQVRPAWATALGLLGVLIASEELVHSGRRLVTLLTTTMSDLATTGPAVSPSLQTMNIMVDCMRIAGGLMLLAAAVLLLRRRKTARALFLIYVVLVWAGYAVGMVARLWAMARVGTGDPYALVGIVNGLLYFLDAYPLFYAIWFLRPTIAKEMATWQ